MFIYKTRFLEKNEKIRKIKLDIIFKFLTDKYLAPIILLWMKYKTADSWNNSFSKLVLLNPSVSQKRDFNKTSTNFNQFGLQICILQTIRWEISLLFSCLSSLILIFFISYLHSCIEHNTIPQIALQIQYCQNAIRNRLRFFCPSRRVIKLDRSLLIWVL